MAAKQGTLAQLSQAGEDAKRAVLSRTGVTSSWFSNLNTVCTIKSAPPRSPEVLQLLATKSGWLFKRNEQHVWQVRWCCAVPHTFLYYFDANIVPSSGTGAPPLVQPTPQQQEDWNRAISNGYGNRKQHEKRSNFYLFNHNNNANSGNDSGNFTLSSPPPNIAAVSYNNAEADDNLQNEFKEADFPNSNFSANMQPAGIIDLECYTSVHRSSTNAHILELAGDDQVNPDLRSFYFCASSSSECEDWTDALLNGRHSSLQDECEAYKQVCEGFAQQLQMLHNDIDEMKKSQEEGNAELYRARCQLEEMRRTVRRLVEDCFERTLNTPSLPTEGDADFQDEWKSNLEAVNVGHDALDVNLIRSKRLEFTRSLETIHSQDMGIPALVRVLAEYNLFLEDSALRLIGENQLLNQKLKQNGQSDQQRAKHLELEIEALKNQKEAEIKQYERTIEALQGKYLQSQKELQDVQNDLSTTRMEVTMYQTQQKTKLAELQQHKKILKKEVIDLRSALEAKDTLIRKSELQIETNKMAIEQERAKTSLLERYVAKIESQVQVQHTMMEMISHSGMGSVYGGSVYVSSHNASSLPLLRRDDHPRSGTHDSPSGRDSAIENERNQDNNRNSDEEHAEHVVHPGDLTQKLPTGSRSSVQPVIPSNGKDSATRRPIHSSRNRRSKLHSPQRRQQQHLILDQDIDNKSHVSELTEDRTQRHFDVYNQYTQGGIQQAPSPRQFDGALNDFTSNGNNRQHGRMGPPLHIIGVNKGKQSSHIDVNVDDDCEKEFDDEDNCEQHAPLDQNGQAKSSLETITSSSKNIVLPILGSAIPSPTLNRLREIPRSSIGSANSVSSSKAGNSKLSVSQRARQEADSSVSSFRIIVDDKTKSLLLKQKGSLSSAPLKFDATGPHEVQGRSPSSITGSPLISMTQSQPLHQVGLWRRVEGAVLGSSSGEDTETLVSNDGTESMHSGPEMDPKGAHGYSRSNKSTEITESSSSNRPGEPRERKLEKTSPGPVRQLTLQERSQLQREKQLNFLREQGLVKNDKEIRGGAGAICDSISVSSSGISQSRSFLSFPGKLMSPGGIG